MDIRDLRQEGGVGDDVTIQLSASDLAQGSMPRRSCRLTDISCGCMYFNNVAISD